MRYTTKRNGKNVIPLLNAVCGIDMPYWRIDRADDLHSYLSGDAADKLAAYEDAEEQGRLVILPCKVGDALFVTDEGTILPAVRMVESVTWWNGKISILAVNKRTGSTYRCLAEDFGKTVFLTREEAKTAMKGERKADV